MRHPLLDPALVSQQDMCPKLQQFIERLMVKHQVDMSVPGTQLLLALPGLADRLLIRGLSEQRISVTHCLADADECLACDTDMVFQITPLGWQPVELVHADTVWHAYIEWCKATNGMPMEAEEGTVHLVNFAEYWAQQLQAQGWLTHGYQWDAMPTHAWQSDHPALQQVAEQLFVRHDIDFTSFAAYLWLDLPGEEKTLLITKRDGYLIHVAYCRTEEEDYLIPQMAVDCVLTVTGTWHPIKVQYEPSIVAQDMQRTEALYDRLMDWLAQQLEAEGWLARSYLVFGDCKKC